MRQMRNKTQDTLWIILIIMFIFLINIQFILSQDSAFGPKIVKESYILSRSKVDRVIYQKDIFKDNIEVTSLVDQRLDVTVSVSENLADIIELSSAGITIGPKNKSTIDFFIKGKEVGNYSGTITLKGGVNEEIPVNLTIIKAEVKPPIFITIELSKKNYILGEKFDFKLNIDKLKTESISNGTFVYKVIDQENKSYVLATESQDILSSTQIIKTFELPKELKEGTYVLEADLSYEDLSVVNKAEFILSRSFLNILIFGFFPMWLLLLLLGLIIFGLVSFYLIKKNIERNQKYQMKLDLKTIPKKDPEFFNLGKIAEKNNPACYSDFFQPVLQEN